MLVKHFSKLGKYGKGVVGTWT